MIEIGRLEASDRGEWEKLFAGYNEFYGRELTAEMADRAWSEFQADTRMHALGAKLDGALVGLAHFLVHPSTTSADCCYLQDLFTAPAARGMGAARALIAAVTDRARARGCARVYWSTRTSNTTARRLYDRVAEDRGFMLYQIGLEP
ncbi:GNAT family N-acetyltransferase [Amycolatopsis sp. cg5]|uniref:GNAT family N-acetyltransferase n=1 Tax=Amycolatopsis sp. cg5 TaxID=3238802 RepID=UPI0035260DFF